MLSRPPEVPPTTNLDSEGVGSVHSDFANGHAGKTGNGQPLTAADDSAGAISKATDKANVAPTDAALWLRKADRLLLGILLVALVILLFAYRWKLSGGWRTEIEIVNQRPRPYFYAIDINRASWVEWAQLDGIGEKLARRIVKDREDRGQFTSVDDLGRVRGIGPKLIEKLKPYLKRAEQRSNPPAESASAIKEPR
jgi:competence protein ComEA